MSSSCKFREVITIDSSHLRSKFECLECILEIAEFEIEVEIEAYCEAGCGPSWDDPGSGPTANFQSIRMIKFEIVSENQECEKNILFLMTKEQKKALEELVELVVENNWDDYVDSAFDAASDYAPEDPYSDDPY